MMQRKRDFSSRTDKLDKYIDSLRKNVSSGSVPPLAIGTIKNAMAEIMYLERGGCDASVVKEYKMNINTVIDRNPVAFGEKGIGRYSVP